METVVARHAIPTSAVVLTLVNGVLFVIGALLHAGIPLLGSQEPFLGGAMRVEAVCAIALGISTMGMFTRAAWALRLARVGNAIGLLGVAAVAVLLLTDDSISTTATVALQIARGLVAIAALIVLSRPVRTVEV